jgi:hypothetical protein
MDDQFSTHRVYSLGIVTVTRDNDDQAEYLDATYGAFIDTAVALLADLIRLARRTAELMVMIAATHTNAAATYRRMVHQRRPDGLRYHQQAG